MKRLADVLTDLELHRIQALLRSEEQAIHELQLMARDAQDLSTRTADPTYGQLKQAELAAAKKLAAERIKSTETLALLEAELAIAAQAVRSHDSRQQRSQQGPSTSQRDAILHSARTKFAAMKCYMEARAMHLVPYKAHHMAGQQLRSYLQQIQQFAKAVEKVEALAQQRSLTPTQAETLLGAIFQEVPMLTNPYPADGSRPWC